MRLILVFIFYFALASIFSQDIQKIDSLLKEIKISANDTNVVKLYLELGEQYEYSLPGSALVYYKKALTVSEEIESKRFTAVSLNKIGNKYMDQGSYSKAVEYFLQSLKIFENLEDKAGMSKNYNNIGIVYWYQELYDKSIEYFQKSLKISEELENEIGMAKCYNNIGMIYDTQGTYDKALEYYQKSLEIAEEFIDKKQMIRCYNNIGTLYYSQVAYDQALEYYHKSLKIAEELADRKGISIISANIAELYIKLKKYTKSAEYSQRSLDTSKEINSLDLQKNAYKVLFTANDSLRDYEKAYNFHKLFKQINDSIFNENSSKEINELLTKYESEKKEKENELLRKDNKIQVLALEKQTTFRNFFITLSAFVMLLVVFFFYRYLKKKKANIILAEKNDLITTQKEQLKRANATKDKFLKIIHHDLLNPFTAIHSTAELLNDFYDKINETKRREYIKLMLTGSNKFLNLMNNLFEWVKSHTGKLEFIPESISLLDVIREELQVQEIFADKKQITVTVNVPNTMNVFADRNMLRTVFRNLVSNAIKFTHNYGSINIKSRKLNEFIEIEITDTGIGINSEDTEKIFEVESTLTSKGTNDERGTGFGLALCKEFIEINNGKILVKSELGAGCTILFTLPKDDIRS